MSDTADKAVQEARNQEYKHLDVARIRETISRLERRIGERFPDSGLLFVAGALNKVAQRTEQTTAWIARPLLALRAFSALLIGLLIFGLFSAFYGADFTFTSVKFAEVIQVTEAAMNELVLIGAAIFFLGSLEVRVKRTRALSVLHELRSIAHIIDMHQLTKDPHKMFYTGTQTLSSPSDAVLSRFELGRYLDYCSELLSLTGKVAALYAESFRDPVALTAVNELETLTTGLSQKVWQKLMILTSTATVEIDQPVRA